MNYDQNRFLQMSWYIERPSKPFGSYHGTFVHVFDKGYPYYALHGSLRYLFKLHVFVWGLKKRLTGSSFSEDQGHMVVGRLSGFELRYIMSKHK